MKILQSLVESEGRNTSKSTEEMLQAQFQSSTPIVGLEDLVQTLDKYQYSNQEVWKQIYPATLTQKFKPHQFGVF